MLSAKNIEESLSGVLFRAVVILSSLIVRRPCCATVIDTSCPPADGGSTLPLFIRMWHPFVKALFLAEVLLRGASLRRHGQRCRAKSCSQRSLPWCRWVGTSERKRTAAIRNKPPRARLIKKK